MNAFVHCPVLYDNTVVKSMRLKDILMQMSLFVVFYKDKSSLLGLVCKGCIIFLQFAVKGLTNKIGCAILTPEHSKGAADVIIRGAFFVLVQIFFRIVRDIKWQVSVKCSAVWCLMTSS